MPYGIVKRKGEKPWKIVDLRTGIVVGSSETKENAQASVRARYSGESGKIHAPKVFK
jgi:hypothetical protein